MPDDHGMLTTYLAERDEPCPGCAYNLRGLTGPRCPECNQELQVRVGLVEPRLGEYLAALCGLLAGVGMATLELGIVAYASLRYGGPPRREAWPIIGIPGVGLVCLSVGLALLLRRRGRAWFRGCEGGARKAVIAGTWGSTIGFVAWVIYSVR